MYFSEACSILLKIINKNTAYPFYSITAYRVTSLWLFFFVDTKIHLDLRFLIFKKHFATNLYVQKCWIIIFQRFSVCMSCMCSILSVYKIFMRVLALLVEIWWETRAWEAWWTRTAISISICYSLLAPISLLSCQP